MLTIEDYKRAYKIAAKIVSKYGDKYLPIFERAHKEFMKAEANLDLKAIALRIAETE